MRRPGRPPTVVVMAIPAALRRARAIAGRDSRFLAAGLPLHLVAVALWIWLAGLVLTAPAISFVPLLVMLGASPALTAAQRWRYRSVLGAGLPRPAAAHRRPGPRRALAWCRSPDAWRQAGYHAAAAPVVAAAEVLVLAAWAAGIVAATIYLWVWALPAGWLFSQAGYTLQAVYITAGGLAVLAIAARLTRAAVRLETRAASALLGPGHARELRRRVEALTESRAGVVDAADAERRRIERDLHDGAQQHLVSLAVNLGLARATLTDLPDSAREVIDQAHREAKEAIAALSDLVRGLHPAVLEDRGLDAALSGLVARVPLPVRLQVSLDSRPSATVEAVAYFVVSEALANVTKHARATRAEVTVRRTGDLLQVAVTDDGAGGADPSGGTGLAGLAQRVSSVDGVLRISSPGGGPTSLTAELPCAP
jgi:signal transduction histidine kinase